MHPKSLIAYIARTRTAIEAGVAHLEEFKGRGSPGPECQPASDGSVSGVVEAEYRAQLGNALGQVRALSRADATATADDQTIDLRSDEYRVVK